MRRGFCCGSRGLWILPKPSSAIWAWRHSPDQRRVRGKPRKPGRVIARSHSDPAAVDWDDRAVDEAGTVGGREDDRFGDLLWGAGTPSRAGRGQQVQVLSHRAVPSVRVGPGLTALTRTPYGPYSAAQDLVSSTSAALLAPYRPIPAA